MNNKTISDLSSISLDELNISCNFVLDDTNKKTRKVSLENIEKRISSDLNIAPEQKISSETWTFVLEDGITEVTKNVCLSIG